MIDNIISNLNKNDNIKEILTKLEYEYSDNIDTVIVMATYNRLEILQKTLTSLSSSNLENTLIIIIDDNSNQDTVEYLRSFTIKNIPCIHLKFNC